MITWGLSLSWWREMWNLLYREFESTKRPISLSSCFEIQRFILQCVIMHIQIGSNTKLVYFIVVCCGSLIWFLLTEADFDQGNKKCNQMGKNPSRSNSILETKSQIMVGEGTRHEIYSSKVWAHPCSRIQWSYNYFKLTQPQKLSQRKLTHSVTKYGKKNRKRQRSCILRSTRHCCFHPGLWLSLRSSELE